jgi:hypothetical protein
MNKLDISRFSRNVTMRVLVVIAVLACLFLNGQTTRAAEWHNLEPLKSRRADVERELGKPLPGDTASGALNFKVAGGVVTVTFVTAKFAQTKKLSPQTEGTVLLIVLQHENSSDTPESIDLVNKSSSRAKKRADDRLYQPEGRHHLHLLQRATEDHALRARRRSTRRHAGVEIAAVTSE